MPLRDEQIFVTGFPGFIASRLVARLASSGARFYILVQSAFVVRAQDEIARIAADANVSTQNFEIIEGDITHDELGLTPEMTRRVRETATRVVHLAAVYDLGVERGFAMRVNVEGTERVNRLAASIKNLRRYDYVSTCYVSGKRTGEILETELEHDAGFHNFYEETKYLAEVSVENLKRDLPVTIHRPAVVVGDSNSGETVKYDGIYYLIHYLRMQPDLLSLVNIGNSFVRLNLVPIDFVVAGIAALMNDDSSIGATIQLADPAPPTTHQLFDFIARALSGRRSLLGMPPSLVQTSLRLPLSEFVTKMPRVAVPYFFIEQDFDTSIATGLLTPHGVVCPPFESYVANLVRFVNAHPKL